MPSSLTSALAFLAFAALIPVCAALLFPFGAEAASLVFFTAYWLAPRRFDGHRRLVVAALTTGAVIVAGISVHIYLLERREALSLLADWAFLSRHFGMRAFMLERSGIDTAFYGLTAAFWGGVVLPWFVDSFIKSPYKENFTMRPSQFDPNKINTMISIILLFWIFCKYNYMVDPILYRSNNVVASKSNSTLNPYAKGERISFLIVASALWSPWVGVWVSLIRKLIFSYSRKHKDF